MIEKEELQSIIPHSGRMLLISRVIDYSLEERRIETEYDITEDCLFYDSVSQGVPGWAGFEFIAQSVSAFIGIRDRGKVKHQFGFILSVSQIAIGLPFFSAGSIIKIKAEEIDHVDSVYVFNGEIFLEDKKILTGKITVMDADSEQLQAMNEKEKTIE